MSVSCDGPLVMRLTAVCADTATEPTSYNLESVTQILAH